MKLIQIIGNLGKEAAVVKQDSINFTVAVPDDVDKTKVDWFNCYYHKVELAQYLTKGKRIFASGRLYTYLGTDGKTKLNVQVDTIKFLESAAKTNSTRNLTLDELKQFGKDNSSKDISSKPDENTSHPLDSKTFDLPY